MYFYKDAVLPCQIVGYSVSLDRHYFESSENLCNAENSKMVLGLDRAPWFASAKVIPGGLLAWHRQITWWGCGKRELSESLLDGEDKKKGEEGRVLRWISSNLGTAYARPSKSLMPKSTFYWSKISKGESSLCRRSITQSTEINVSVTSYPVFYWSSFGSKRNLESGGCETGSPESNSGRCDPRGPTAVTNVAQISTWYRSTFGRAVIPKSSYHGAENSR